jgi:hypothetical protein
MIILEYIEDIKHIRTWDDIKKVFGGHVEEYPGVNNNPQSGQSGRVWKIKGKELALKITTEPEEMKLTEKLVGKNNKGFINIYKAVEIPPHRHNGRKVPRLMLKVQEFCYPIPELKKHRFSSFLPYLMQYVMEYYYTEIEDNTFQSIEDFKEMYDEFKNSEYLPLRNFSQKPEAQKEFTPILIKFIDMIKRVKSDADVEFHELDVHGDNIMQTKEGAWKLVDF